VMEVGAWLGVTRWQRSACRIADRRTANSDRGRQPDDHASFSMVIMEAIIGGFNDVGWEVSNLRWSKAI